MYIYIHVCVCVCVCILIITWSYCKMLPICIFPGLTVWHWTTSLSLHLQISVVFTPHPEKLFFATDRQHFRKPQPIKNAEFRAQCQWIHPQNTPTPKTQGTLQIRGLKNSKSQRTKEFAVRLCALVILEITPIKSHQHDWMWASPVRVEQSDTSGLAKLDGKNPQGLSSTQRTAVN